MRVGDDRSVTHVNCAVDGRGIADRLTGVYHNGAVGPTDVGDSGLRGNRQGKQCDERKAIHGSSLHCSGVLCSILDSRFTR